MQSSPSASNFKLTRVGVTDVKKLVHIKRPGKKTSIPLVVKMDLFVDLPASQKGSHMSRNLEIISEIIDMNLKQPVTDLESFCAKTAKLLLEKHEYASFSEVKAEADYFLDRVYPSGKKGLEPYTIVAEARAKSNGEVKKLIGVRVIGMTACPCAYEVIKTIHELMTRGHLTQRAWQQDVQVMIEGPGHVPLNQVKASVLLQKQLCHQAPFYVLGPLVTDIAAGHDHVACAIGGAVAGEAGADFLCYVIPTEHLCLPSVEDVREGVVVTKIAAHAADIARGHPLAIERDRKMSVARKNLDWEAQMAFAIDPKKARRLREENPPG